MLPFAECATLPSPRPSFFWIAKLPPDFPEPHINSQWMLSAFESKANQQQAFEFITQHNKFLFKNDVDGVYIIVPGYMVSSDKDLEIWDSITVKMSANLHAALIKSWSVHIMDATTHTWNGNYQMLLIFPFVIKIKSICS